MNTKWLNLRTILVLCLGAAMMMGAAAWPIPTWEQVNEDGFGNYLNLQLPALAEFQGYLYNGVWNVEWSEEYQTWFVNGQIWRSVDGETWEMVFNTRANGVATLIAFKEHIYAASWGPEGKVWRSRDGLDWEEVTNNIAGSNLDAARFAVYKDALYLSSWNGDVGTIIWKTTDGTQWSIFNNLDNSDPGNAGAIASEAYKGFLYWGVCNWDTGPQIWRTDGTSLETVMVGGLDGNLSAVSALAQFGNELYLSGWNDDTWQALLWRSANGTDWELVQSLDDMAGRSALEVYRNQLYWVIEDQENGLDVWTSINGLDWWQVGFDGFDDPGNVDTFWDSATTVFRGDLFIATENWYNGGEVWRLSLNE